MIKNKELKKKLHSLALKHNIQDKVAELIVLCPFLFQEKEINKLDLKNVENLEELKTNFYHKNLGRFYIKERVLNKIKENNGK